MGFKRGLRNAKSSGWPCPMQGLPSSVAQEPLLKVIFFFFSIFIPFAPLVWVTDIFLLASVFTRILLTHWALMPGPPSRCCVAQLSSPGVPVPAPLLSWLAGAPQQLCSASYGKSRTLIPFLKSLQPSPFFGPALSPVVPLLPGQKCWPSAPSLEVTSHTQH